MFWGFGILSSRVRTAAAGEQLPMGTKGYPQAPSPGAFATEAFMNAASEALAEVLVREPSQGQMAGGC